MLLKTLTLSLALLFGIGVIVPLATDNAEAGTHVNSENSASTTRNIQEMVAAISGASGQKQSSAGSPTGIAV